MFLIEELECGNVTTTAYHSSYNRCEIAHAKEDVLFGIVALPYDTVKWQREGITELLWQEHIQPKSISKIRKFLAFLLDALLRTEGTAAYIPITFVTITIFVGSSWQVFLSTSDPARYQCYALTFWFGSNALHMLPATQCAFLQTTLSSVQPAFHMLPMEYPPLTLVPFSLALLVPLSYYQLAIAFIMALAAVFIYWLLLQYGPRGAALAFAISLLVGAVGTAQRRFRSPASSSYTTLCHCGRTQTLDFSLCCACFWCTTQNLSNPAPPSPFYCGTTLSWTIAYTCPKKFAQIIATTTMEDVAHCADNGAGTMLLLCLGIILGVTGFFATLEFSGCRPHADRLLFRRPVQVEAVGSTLLWLAQDVGFPLTIGESYGSLNIISALAGIVSDAGNAFPDSRISLISSLCSGEANLILPRQLLLSCLSLS